MILIVFFLCLHSFVYSQDICNSVYCGSGICISTENPTLPYYCQCQNGSNTILPCPSEDPCSRNPCGQGTCEIASKSYHGYLCRCADDTISLTSCNVIRNACATNPCINGLCIEGLTSFICNCLPTWTGRFCDTRTDLSCSINLCDAGQCFQINDPSFPYVCLCPNGQFSTTCQTSTTSVTSTAQMITTISSISNFCNPLQDNACMNRGECLPTVNGYRCLCAEDYTGHFCETKMNPCASYPCLYGGICYNLQSSYICACPDGSFRSQCLSTTVLPSVDDTMACPCRNGGVCTVNGSPPTCTCPTGLTGQFCENLLYNSCRGIVCHNGGTCYEKSVDSSDSMSCLCKNGYTGQFCEIEYFRCLSNGRFTDQYNCVDGKYFECIYYEQDEPNIEGQLLSRSCPSTLRYNVRNDQCDYPQNVQCI